MTDSASFFEKDIPIEKRIDVTVDELEQMSLPGPAELYDGKIIIKMITFAEGVINANICYQIGSFLESHPVGHVVCHVNFRLRPDKPRESRAPDLSFVLKENLPENWHRYLPIAPDLVIEILSPKDSFAEMMEKVDEYLTQGAKLVWVVIINVREVMVCSKESKYIVRDKLTAPELLPGFELPVEAIFAGLVG